jgi:hypothetical protein
MVPERSNPQPKLLELAHTQTLNTTMGLVRVRCNRLQGLRQERIQIRNTTMEQDPERSNP